MKHEFNTDNLPTAEYFMLLADNMASAAVSFNSHGYDTFIESREKFKKDINEFLEIVEENSIN